MRKLVDPNISLLRTLSRDERDLLIAAKNSWCVAYENLRTLSAWISDAICRLATGGGLTTRELYTDEEEILLDAQRPVLLNGISGIIEQPDLVDRALQVTLPEIEEKDRVTEEKFWPRFDKAAPGILGVLLDVIAVGLSRLPETQLERLPRMADFALWATACEEALGWQSGDFMKAYDSAKANLTRDALEAEPVATYLMTLAKEGEWEGVASELLAKLNEMAGYADGKHRPPKGWPGAGHILSRKLKRLAPALRSQDVEVKDLGRKGKNGSTMWVLRKVVKSSPSSPSQEVEGAGNADTDSKNVAEATTEATEKTEASSVSSDEVASVEERRRGRYTDATEATEAKKQTFSSKREAPPFEDEPEPWRGRVE